MSAAGSAIAWSIAISRQLRPALREGRRVGSDGPDSRRQLRVPSRQQVEQHGRLDNEHACIPTEFARREIVRGARGVRFLDELADPRRRRVTVERMAHLDVAEGGRRKRRLHPDGHDVVLARHGHRLGHARPEGLGVRDDVVGSERPDHRLRVLSLDDGSRPGDGRHRVTRAGLGQHPVGGQTRQLGTHGFGVRDAGDDDDPVGGERRDPVDGALDEGVALTGEIVQELRVAGARERPETRAGAAGRDDGPEVGDRGHAGHLSDGRRGHEEVTPR
jgi:hypothetical protein